MTVEKEIDNEVYLGADPVHPEDLEPDVILPGEEGYEAPAESDSGAEGGDGQGVQDEGTEPEKQKEADSTPEEKEAEAESAEPEQEAEPEVEPEQPKNQMIPKGRLDKELRHRRMLEAKLREYEKNGVPQAMDQPPAKEQSPQAPAPAPELDTAALEEAFLEGNMQKFGESLQTLLSSRDTQMRETIKAELTQNIQQQVPEHLQQNQRQQSFEDARYELETQHEFLDPNSENYDEGLVQTISNFTSSYVGQGYQPGDALREAAEKVLKIEKPELFQQAPAPAPEKQQQVRQQRMNIDQKLKAAQQQPPAMESGDVDNVDPLPDFDNMSEAEFDKLTDAQLDEYLTKAAERR